MLRSYSFAVLGAVLVACASQAETSYKGEALAELNGVVENSMSTAPSEPLDAALSWSGAPLGVHGKDVAQYRQIPGTTVPVTGSFPAKFTLQIFTPPPGRALFSCFHSDPSHPGMAASASLQAILRGHSTSDLDITDLYGSVDDYIIIYADSDLPADNDCKIGALTKGYHLLHREPPSQPANPECEHLPPDADQCNAPWPYVEVPMSTPLTLRLWHEDGNAAPPSGPVSPPPAADNTANTEDTPPAGG